MAKKKIQKLIQKPFDTVTIARTYQIHNWRDGLTFEQLMETLYVVGSYLENSAWVAPEDEKIIQEWMANNSMQKFLEAKDLAMTIQLEAEEMEEELQRTASDITGISSRKHQWH